MFLHGIQNVCSNILAYACDRSQSFEKRQELFFFCHLSSWILNFMYRNGMNTPVRQRLIQIQRHRLFAYQWGCMILSFFSNRLFSYSLNTPYRQNTNSELQWARPSTGYSVLVPLSIVYKLVSLPVYTQVEFVLKVLSVCRTPLVSYLCNVCIWLSTDTSSSYYLCLC